MVPSEAVVRRCSVKKVFLKTSQNSQENTCARVSFLIKRLTHEAWNFIKKETLAQVFTCEFSEISKNTFFTEQFRWLLLYHTSSMVRTVLINFLLETFTSVINFSLKEKCLNRFILPKVFYCVICCCKTGNVEFL